MAPPDTEEQITLYRDWCADMALRLRLPRLQRRVQVGWNPRMRTTAGRAWWPDGLIELNPRLRACGEEEIWRTLKHEFAHLVAYERAGRKLIRPHGPEWAAACNEVGIPGESAYHGLPFPRRRQKRRYRYTCPVCAKFFKRARAVKGVTACYPCCRKHAQGRFDRRFVLQETRED